MTKEILRATIPAGDYWLHVVEKGQTLRIVDAEGNQAADTLFFNADDPFERYSAADTIRAQGNVYLGVGSRLLSQDGNLMLTITNDTV
ncbi:MAG: urea carboxylase-associated family protein, partial [Pseudomonadota bacterium]